MKCWTLWLLAIAFHLLMVCINCNRHDDEEPHSYTISFFQFDPKDIGSESDVKKESKKDIKPSDAELANKLGNSTDVRNTTTGTRLTNFTVRNETDQVPAGHLHWNTTDTQKQNASPTNNHTKPPAIDYQSYKKNENELDSRNIQEHNKTKTNAVLQGKSEIKKNGSNDQNEEKKKEKPRKTDDKGSMKLKEANVKNGTKLDEKERINASSANTTNNLPNNSTLKTEYENFKRNVSLLNTTSLWNTTGLSNAISLSNTTGFLNTTTAITPNKVNGANLTMPLNNSTAKANATNTEKRSDTPHVNNVNGNRKALVLNPNPSPSQTEAVMHLKTPQFQNTYHKIPLLKIVDNKLFENNSTVTTNDTNSSGLTEKSVTLRKDGAAKENSTQTERKPIVTDKKAKDKGQTVIVKQAAEKNNSSAKNETAEKAKKLEKDKKTNKEILAKAKNIKPVENKVKNASISHNTSTVISGIKKHHVQQQALKQKKASSLQRSNSQSKTQIQRHRHREMLSHFIPVYDINPQERSMGFQLGSLKHPKHDLYPKCHHCPRNSTYSHCVRKATIKKCNNGLNNICFTKSHRRNGVITYQMGCADHKKCMTAKAFPCKDGSKACFTCCQFDRCNSSPHHGDYELDELNMSEVQLDTNNSAQTMNINWFYHIMILAMQLMIIKVLN